MKVKDWSKENIIKQFKKSGDVMMRATLEGDYKKNNKEGKKLTEIFKQFEANTKLAMNCLPELMKSNNVVVKTKAAAYCLALNIMVNTAENLLIEISDDPKNGIFGFNAKMVLKVWHENGKLEIYQKKK
ncbi:hypothetical protein [Holdemania massiliensis]|uniref:hypothetical protein n=1 Tax=Holdemania massiliensis TaxID=1468449 RepID=UPI001F05951E|nr:hypothetical protein [Holdemania massiliensis]MCH1939874.1 hypothetical protein [Holdemania massiliensis]